MEAASRLRSWRAREGARASGLTRSEQSHFERKWKREKKRQDSLRGEESERERERERERESWRLGAWRRSCWHHSLLRPLPLYKDVLSTPLERRKQLGLKNIARKKTWSGRWKRVEGAKEEKWADIRRWTE